jgi:hypothetical protein
MSGYNIHTGLTDLGAVNVDSITGLESVESLDGSIQWSGSSFTDLGDVSMANAYVLNNSTVNGDITSATMHTTDLTAVNINATDLTAVNITSTGITTTDLTTTNIVSQAASITALTTTSLAASNIVAATGLSTGLIASQYTWTHGRVLTNPCYMCTSIATTGIIGTVSAASPTEVTFSFFTHLYGPAVNTTFNAFAIGAPV